MTIAVVDDELETRQYMHDLIAQYLRETGRSAQVEFYPDGASFLVGCEQPDIVLMPLATRASLPPRETSGSTARKSRIPSALVCPTPRLSRRSKA